MIRFHCFECGVVYGRGRDDRGKAFECVRCSTRLAVPPKDGPALPGKPVVVLKILNPSAPGRPTDKEFEQNDAPNIAALAMMALILCWMLAAIKLYKQETLQASDKAELSALTFTQRMGLDPVPLPMNRFKDNISLNIGLTVVTGIAILLVCAAAPRVGVKRPVLGLGLLAFALPLPLIALI